MNLLNDSLSIDRAEAGTVLALKDRMAMTDSRVRFARLCEFITLAMTRLGLPAVDAAIVGGLVAKAELQGFHGLPVRLVL